MVTKIIQRFLFLIGMALLHTSSFASDFEVDGICYNILSDSNNEVEVTPKKNKYGTNLYSGDISIPSEVVYGGNKYIVTTIGEIAFWDCGHNIKSVTLPNTIKTIGDYSFKSLWDLKSIDLPSSLITIGDEAFCDCQSLESIDIPENVTSIGANVFKQCKILKSVTVGNSLKDIGNGAFSYCSLLGEINIGSVEKLGRGAFAECTNLRTVILPQNLQEILENTFYFCKSLKSVIIPESVRSIGDWAFCGCSALDTVISKIEEPFEIPESVFNQGSNDSHIIKHPVLLVPYGSKNKYQQYLGWYKYFAKIEEEIPNYSFTIESSGNGSVSYDGNTIRNDNWTSSVNAGETCSIIITPDDGYRIKSVKVNNTDVTSSVSNNIYTINSISSDTSVEVEFEAIPPTTYTLSIKATGNGTATYDDIAIKNNTKTFTINEGTSATIKFTPDDGNRIKSVKLDDKDATSSVTNNRYTISEIAQNMTLEVTFEETPKYTVDLIVSGNGVVKHKNLSYRNKTQQFIGPEGYSLTFQLEPDDGYRIASVKENDQDVTSSIVDNQYTVSNIKENKTLKVTFEAIPPTTYTLSVKATGNGSATYDGTTIKNNTSTFTVNEGTSATITFTPDNGYRIKSVKVGSTNVTSSVSKNSYTISSISGDTTVEVEFEAIPPTTYTLSIKATGNGSATYDGTTIKNKTNTFTVTEGSSATITFAPDNGYRIKNVKVNSTDVTSSVSNSKYTISSVSGDTSVEVEFEAIPPTTYTLSIKATGNGSATYDGTVIKNQTSTFTVNEGTSVTITFTPDNGYRIKSVKVGSTDVTSSVSNNKYTISSISGNTTVEIEFEAIPTTTYTLSITATGNGSASYDGTTIRGKTSSFTVTEGSDLTISFTPDNGYQIMSVVVDGYDVTSHLYGNEYTIYGINDDTSIEVEFEAIPATTYTLSITVTGNGSVSYDGATIRGKTSSFEVDEGSSATITFTPDEGNRIKSVKVNSTDVTSSVTNGKYTISSISDDMSVEVEFEVIPPTTYTLSIKATGNGSATYDGTTIKNQTSTFTVNEGTIATITFTPDIGCRIKSVNVNNSDVTSSVVNNSYTVNNISRNTDIEVEFEVIPSTTYTMSITATGNGSATYEGTVIKNNTSSFTVNEGANATITFTPDNGYRIKSVKANNTDVTSKVVNNAYIVSNIRSNTTIEVEFEAIPATAYTLSIKATGNGSVTYDGTSVRDKTSSFSVNGGTSATITLSADNGNRIKSVTVNNTDVTSKVMNNSYTISNISGNTSVEVVFEEIIAELTNEGVYYEVVSETQQTVKIVSVDNGLVLDVPASFTAKDKEWKVVGVEANILSNPELAAIIWNPEVVFNGIVDNPNLLLYVKDKKYAPDDIQNVVVNGEAEDIVLQDAEDGNNFYCPQDFTAKRISYIHRYSMKTGFKTCQGWETIVLPFDVTTILSATGTEIVPYIAWQQGSSSRPFWLYSLNDNGWKAENGIKANTSYIISMPNNEEYDATYNLSGDIQFMSSNVQVMSSEGMSASKSGNKQLVPNYQNKVASQDIYALNVNSQWNTNTATKTEGSAFIRSLRQVRPFEAYMTIEGGAGARRAIPIFDEDTNGIQTIPWSIDRSDDAIYNLNGQRVNSMTRGIYIQNGKKIIKR